jgi:cell division protein FtsI (penicillin-binding protein 3)
VEKETRPKVVRRVISDQTARRVAGILEGVVDEEGTGSKAAISGFRVAGKTGTSQKVDPKSKKYSRTEYVATFVGFVPLDHPRLVILVVIDEPKGIPYGGVVAAPVFSEIGLWSLNHLQVNPKIRLVEKGIDAREKTSSRSVSTQTDRVSIEVKTGFLPDFRGLGMRKVISEARSLGLKTLLEGSGLAVKQNPKPGSPLQKVHTVKVVFRPPA